MALPLTPDEVEDFQARLFAWFRQARRAFPWRLRDDPYSVLLAEKLLQQTAARPGVVNAYQQLCRRYPTPLRLARARLRVLEKIVQPLGFPYRAKELRELARTLVIRHGGEVPRNLEDLLALPGVGDYAARAVLTFAFADDVPVVDTNVCRFLYRLYGIPGVNGHTNLPGAWPH